MRKMNSRGRPAWFYIYRIRIFVGALIFFFAAGVQSGKSQRLYIWNVGQGQWITWVTDRRCEHFDMGGERAPFRKLKALCQNRLNTLYLSHGDLDHISFIWWGVRNLPGLCLIDPPREKLSFKKSSQIAKLPLCSGDRNSFVKEIPTLARAGLKPNDISRVVTVEVHGHSVLLPGDSTGQAERFWSRHPLTRVRLLILGHHGSKTSTSTELLRRLPRLKIGVGSARQRRYGHPHPTVVERLRSFGVPVLMTEVWGDIAYEM